MAAVIAGPNGCGCFCGACAQELHVHCSNVTPCRGGSECGCRCGACKNKDHRNCSNVDACPRKGGAGMVSTPPVEVGPAMQDALDVIAGRPAARHPIAVRETESPPAAPRPTEPAALRGADTERPPSGIPRGEDPIVAMVFMYLGRLEARLSVFDDEVSEYDPSAERSRVLLELAQALTFCRELVVKVGELQVKVERVSALSRLLESEQ